jgi:hypothetical protein
VIHDFSFRSNDPNRAKLQRRERRYNRRGDHG